MTYQEYLKRANELNEKVNATSKELNDFLKANSSLVTGLGTMTDEGRNNVEYKELKSSYNTAFQALRNFNGVVNKYFKKYPKRFHKEKREARQKIK